MAAMTGAGLGRFASRRIRRPLVLTLGFVLACAMLASTPAGAESAINVRGFGGAHALGAPATALNAPLVGIASDARGTGYWLLGQDGGIFSYGSARFYGSTGALHLNQPVVGIAATPTGHGYWLVAADGGVFTFGDARFYGSTGALRLNAPIVGMAATPSGHGYWLVAADGGVFTFGDARFHGSTGGSALNAPIVAMTSSVSGHGYWIASADGRIFNFGDASAMHAANPSSPIVGLARNPKGTGLWLVANDGDVYTAGTAKFSGSVTSGGVEAAVGIAPAAPGHGYWIATQPSGPPLPPNSGTGRRIVYSNKEQRIWLVEANGVVSHTFLVSGRHGLPAVGVDHVYSKVPSSPSGDLTLPWTLRFAYSSDGTPIDLHGIPLEPDGTPIEPDSLLGTPESHGCVRLSQADAEFVWNWSTVGTTVVVTDLGY
ncbi:MAG: L,D-transpeptidase [Acidimicrobiia bacterium]